MENRIVIKRLAMTGPERETREIGFFPGLNVIWGASNAGKSFVIKSLDYMFGSGSLLPEIKQREGMEACWLELDLPKSGAVTLRRSLSGGGVSIFDKPLEDVGTSESDRVLSSSHSATTPSLSGMLLEELGVSRKQIANNTDGKKSAFTFRHFAHYMFTEETPMMAEWSPIQISAQSGPTFDKNVFKFLLTGVDDSLLVVAKSTKEQQTENVGKIEIVEEMISVALDELGRMFPEDNLADLDLDDQDRRISATISSWQSTLSLRQSRLDALVSNRRSHRDQLADFDARAEQIELTLSRFDLLGSVYNSDLERLEGLGEGAEALLAGAQRTCPLCGADPDHQRHAHGYEAVELSQKAVSAEMAKIRAEKADLTRAVRSLSMERKGVNARRQAISEELQALDLSIATARPSEAQARTEYERLDRERQRIRNGLSLKRRIDALEKRRAELATFKPRRQTKDAVTAGVSGTAGHDFAMVVQSILRAWQFPGEPVVAFDGRTHDILLNGSDRRSNGKGVRALMNAAFKIGVLEFCRERGLPHPGIIALDSPLLSYRDPHKSRHGELSEDEVAVKNANLNTYFYGDLAHRAKNAQFIIVENDPPPNDLPIDSRVTTFTGPFADTGRKGFL